MCCAMNNCKLLNALAIVILLVGTGLRIFDVIDRPVLYVFVGLGFLLSLLARFLGKRPKQQD